MWKEKERESVERETKRKCGERESKERRCIKRARESVCAHTRKGEGKRKKCAEFFFKWFFRLCGAISLVPDWEKIYIS